MENLSREELMAMVRALSNVMFDFVDVNVAEMMLRQEGLESEHLAVIGFDVDE